LALFLRNKSAPSLIINHPSKNHRGVRMRIGIIGASGNFGQRVLTEASNRGHQVVAFSRDVSRRSTEQSGVTWKVGDVQDSDGLVKAVEGLDVLISCYGPGSAARDLKGAVDQAVSDPQAYVTAAKTLLKVTERHRTLRLIVVGGAGSLEVEPGLQLVDSPGYGAGMKSRGMDERYRVVVLAHRDALNLYRTSNRNWTYLSPAMQNFAGERTGRFRIGGNRLMTDAEGKSRISYEDIAVALIDEVEVPRHIERRFSIAY
jgi:putative NADH-flavin reductase